MLLHAQHLVCNFDLTTTLSADDRVDEYHQQLHHGSDDLDMEANDEQGFQPVSDAKLQRLGRIVKDLRSRVPISAEAPGEKTMIPNTKDVSCIHPSP